MSPSTMAAHSAVATPAGVRRAPVGARSRRGICKSRSSALSRMLAAGWLTPWASTAARMDPISPTLTSKSSDAMSGYGSGSGTNRP